MNKELDELYEEWFKNNDAHTREYFQRAYELGKKHTNKEHDHRASKYIQ